MTATQPAKPSPTPRKESRPDAVDGLALKHLLKASLAWLSVHQQTVNALNVFPIPDGDTGTNMLLTMQAACREIEDVNHTNAGKIAHGAAHGALMGARGNSGVILSQILRGLARSLDNKPFVDGPAFIDALVEARNTAYKGVMRPVEGTILTVIHDSAAAAQAAPEDKRGFSGLLEIVVEAARVSVEHTPDLLPVLREAGVVDAGGKGLFYIWEGMLRHLHGESLDQTAEPVPSLDMLNLARAEEFIEEGQDYEVIVDFSPSSPLELSSFYPGLEAMGTSIQLGQGDDFYRLHIHVPTENRYEPIEYVLRIGTVSKVAIENLQSQVSDRKKTSTPDSVHFPPVQIGQIAVVAVSPGLGLTRIFSSLGVSAVVSGGQTMNPSTEELFAAFRDFPTDRIILLPNNKNILLAAQQVPALTNKQVVVVPSRTIPQGIAAMLAFQQDGNLEEIARAMTSSLSSVDTGEVTIATRTVQLNGIKVKNGDFIGLHNGNLIASGKSVDEALLTLLQKMSAESRELITLYWGGDLNGDNAVKVTDAIREAFPSLEVEVHEGNQPHYPFILSVE